MQYNLMMTNLILHFAAQHSSLLISCKILHFQHILYADAHKDLNFIVAM